MDLTKFAKFAQGQVSLNVDQQQNGKFHALFFFFFSCINNIKPHLAPPVFLSTDAIFLTLFPCSKRRAMSSLFWTTSSASPSIKLWKETIKLQTPTVKPLMNVTVIV